jgi:hypothetical protein
MLFSSGGVVALETRSDAKMTPTTLYVCVRLWGSGGDTLLPKQRPQTTTNKHTVTVEPPLWSSGGRPPNIETRRVLLDL